VLGVGLDWDSKNKQIMVSNQITKPSEMQSSGGGGGGAGGSGGSGKEPTVIIQTSNKTVFGAIRMATFENSRKLNFTHNEVIVIGKSVGTHGIGPFLDFFSRDPEPRPTQIILYTDGEAKKVLEAKPEIEKATAVEIRKMVDNSNQTSEVERVILQDLIEMLISKSRSATLPMVEVKKSKTGQHPVLNGTAVFKKDIFAGKLDHQETRGLLWIMGKVQSGIIDVPSKEGALAIEIIEASGKFKPLLKNGKMMVAIEVKMEGNIGTEMTPMGTENPDGLKKLQRKIEAVVRDEVLSSVMEAKKLKADIFGFGEAFRRKYPKEWQSMESRWEELFPKVKVNLKVKAIIRRTGETLKPIYAKK
jgi:spore germination protein KC